MISRYLIVLFAAAAFLTVTGCKTETSTTNTNTTNPANANRVSQSTPDEFAAVKAIYAKDCQECHGAKGDGGPVTLKDGSKLKVPTFRSGHALRHSDAEFVKQITKGGDGMPAFADKLKTDEINDLIKFIRKEFQAGATPAGK